MKYSKKYGKKLWKSIEKWVKNCQISTKEQKIDEKLQKGVKKYENLLKYENRLGKITQHQLKKLEKLPSSAKSWLKFTKNKWKIWNFKYIWEDIAKRNTEKWTKN